VRTPVPNDAGGLAAQRTVLAWERTALGILVNGALLVLRDAGSADPVALAGACWAAALALVTVALGIRRRDVVLRGARVKDIPPAPGLLATLTVGILVLGVLDVLSFW
jgi:uncharacterized membrane protein YidH (DUF202 family)